MKNPHRSSSDVHDMDNNIPNEMDEGARLLALAQSGVAVFAKAAGAPAPEMDDTDDGDEGDDGMKKPARSMKPADDDDEGDDDDDGEGEGDDDAPVMAKMVILHAIDAHLSGIRAEQAKSRAENALLRAEVAEMKTIAKAQAFVFSAQQEALTHFAKATGSYADSPRVPKSQQRVAVPVALPAEQATGAITPAQIMAKAANISSVTAEQQSRLSGYAHHNLGVAEMLGVLTPEQQNAVLAQ